jgi:glyoxylase-like metal-dependent hydrolase (beta-lactamase superfamily II)
LSWQVGDVRITQIVELTTASLGPYLLPQATPEALDKIDWLEPFVDARNQIVLSIHALVLETPDQCLVVDTCIGNDKPRSITGGQPLQTKFLELLKEAGCAADKVDTVVCTHLHVDHVGWNTMKKDGKWVPTFPNARYLIGRQEYEHWSKEGDVEAQEILSDSVKPIFEKKLATLVEMDHRISKEISLTPTPGHTPGHVSVMIESKGSRAMITGDMLHHPCQFGHPEWSPPFDSDPAAGAKMRRSVMERVAGQPVLVIGTHFAAPTAGHVKKDGSAFRFDVG